MIDTDKRLPAQRRKSNFGGWATVGNQAKRDRGGAATRGELWLYGRGDSYGRLRLGAGAGWGYGYGVATVRMYGGVL